MWQTNAPVCDHDHNFNTEVQSKLMFKYMWCSNNNSPMFEIHIVYIYICREAYAKWIKQYSHFLSLLTLRIQLLRESFGLANSLYVRVQLHSQTKQLINDVLILNKMIKQIGIRECFVVKLKMQFFFEVCLRCFFFLPTWKWWAKKQHLLLIGEIGFFFSIFAHHIDRIQWCYFI